VLSSLFKNVVVFNASSPCKDHPPSEHEWELLTIGGNKQKENGFTFGELIAMLENTPNCCR